MFCHLLSSSCCGTTSWTWPLTQSLSLSPWRSARPPSLRSVAETNTDMFLRECACAWVQNHPHVFSPHSSASHTQLPDMNYPAPPHRFYQKCLEHVFILLTFNFCNILFCTFYKLNRRTIRPEDKMSLHLGYADCSFQGKAEMGESAKRLHTFCGS